MPFSAYYIILSHLIIILYCAHLLQRDDPCGMCPSMLHAASHSGTGSLCLAGHKHDKTFVEYPKMRMMLLPLSRIGQQMQIMTQMYTRVCSKYAFLSISYVWSNLAKVTSSPFQEIFDSALLGEGLLPSMRHAARHLIKVRSAYKRQCVRHAALHLITISSAYKRQCVPWNGLLVI